MKKTEEKHKKLPFFGIGKLLPFIRPYRGMITVMVICGILGTMWDIAATLLERYALNHFIAGHTTDTLWLFVIFSIIGIVAMGALGYACGTRATTVEVSINRDLRNAAFRHLQTLSFSYYSQNSVGYIHSRLMSDASRIGSLASWTIMESVWHIAYLIGAIVVMFSINAKLAAMIVSIVSLVALLFLLFQKKLVAVNREIREINSRITSDFNEGITGARTVKSLVIEDKMEHDFHKNTDEMWRKSSRHARLRGLFAATMGFASSLALAIVLWKGGYIAAEEVGTFSMFMAYAQGMMEPIRWLIDSISDLITTEVNIERLFGLMETQPDVTDSQAVIEKYGDCFHPKTENWEPIRGDIEFRHVDFKYPDGDEYVLRDFNLTIPFGSSIAIVGETGAGKSTLANLICRFYEPTAGQVLIDGKDVRERSQYWLHSALGYVLQTPHLFSGSIRDNLLVGKPDATDDEIISALHDVSADTMLEHLERGLDSEAGESGDLLSMGEKQLISFARAILADPRILILDEATASVDSLTEAKIQAAIVKIIHGRTSVVIAHRLSTVRNADMILVVKDGQIIESGKHEVLMAEKGAYWRLY
ncbi:MAG: ABC transporter ATP-binding protein, partial [Victivallales bacterium]|nr:ABC transporter ATP-binding protein [Victivallales bacterium]